MGDDLADLPTGELRRAMGILVCERMLYARPAEVEARIDARIASIEAEIKRREALSPTPDPEARDG